MPTNPLDYVLYTENATGRGHPTLGDTANRVARSILSRSGWDPDGDFYGFTGGSDRTYNAAAFPGVSSEAKIQAAIDQAVLDGIETVYIPAILFPYDPGSVTFDTSVRMTREGQLADVYDALAYGAAANGSTDDLAALTALIAALPVGGIAYLPAGTYAISGSLTINNASVTLAGAGRSVSTITLTTANTAAVILGSNAYHCHIHDCSIFASSYQNASQTSSFGIRLDDAVWVTLERLEIHGFRQAIGNGGGATFGIASSTFRDLLITRWSDFAIYLVPVTGGIDGIIMDNIYMLSRDPGTLARDTVTGCLKGSAIGNGHFRNLFMQTCLPTECVLDLNDCDAIVMDGLHFEDLQPQTDLRALVYCHTGRYTMRGVAVLANEFLVGKVPNAYAIFRSDSNTQYVIDGVTSRSNTVTTSNYREWLESGTTNVEIYMRGVNPANDTSWVGYFSVPGVLKEHNTSRSTVSADRGDASVTLSMADEPTQRFATALGANRTVTLPSSGMQNGDKFRIVRTGLGAFTLAVGALKTIPNSTAAFIDVEYDGSAWRLTGYGTL